MAEGGDGFGRGSDEVVSDGALDGALERVQANKNREWQVARTGGRKLFRGQIRKTFLEWFAATGNAVYSAGKAGVCHQTVWKHRMDDPRFAEAFDRALEQGIVRAKARMIEDRIKGPIEFDGGAIAEAELEPPDPQTVLSLVREYERAKAGVRKSGRPPRAANEKEVTKALEKRLRAYAARIAARDAREAAAGAGGENAAEAGEAGGSGGSGEEA